jgi:hypothetical protein
MKLKFVEIVNKEKVYSNFRKIKRVLLGKFQEEEAVILAGAAKNQYLPEQGLISKK